MKCEAKMHVGGRGAGSVWLHCARTDEHSEHRATINGQLRTWTSGPQRDSSPWVRVDPGGTIAPR